MREIQGLRQVTAVVLLLVAAAARGDCVSTVRSVSQMSIFPNLVAGPIATNGSIVVAGKTDPSTSTPGVDYSLYDTSLNPISADRQVATSSFNGPVALLYADSSNEFGLFFQQTNGVLMLQRIDASGNPIGAPIAMPHNWSLNDDFQVVWDKAAGAYALAHLVTSGPDLGAWLTLVSPSGSIVSDTNVTLFATGSVRVAVLPDGTAAVLWSRPGSPGPTFVTLVSNGAVTHSTLVTSQQLDGPVIATNGSSILVIYQSPKSGGGTELRDFIVNASGTVTSADASMMSGKGVDIAPLSLQWNPALSEWALVYADSVVGFNEFPGEVHLRRFQTLSGTASDTFLSPNAIFDLLPARFPIVFLNNGYVASIARLLSIQQGGESYLVSLCPLVGSIAVDRTLARPFDTITFRGSASGGTPGYTYTWQFGDNDSLSGQTVQHHYSAVGTYTVTLTAHDAAGATSVARITVGISDTVRGRAARH